MNFDRDRSGTMEGHELQQAITSFGKVMVSIFVTFDVTMYRLQLVPTSYWLLNAPLLN